MCEIIQNIISGGIIILGWFVAHRCSKRRDLANKKREMKIAYLTEAYRTLKRSFVSNDPKEFINAIDDIQLFGSKEAFRSLNEELKWYIDNQSWMNNPSPLLKYLRDELRKEIKIDQADEEFIFLSESSSKIIRTCHLSDVSKNA